MECVTFFTPLASLSGIQFSHIKDALNSSKGSEKQIISAQYLSMGRCLTTPLKQRMLLLCDCAMSII